MQTRLIRYFLAVEREGHFGRAAQACHVSQPTLSSGIAALEAQLGRRLIHRDHKFAGLTGEGQAVLPWARQMLAALDGMTQATQSIQGPLRGEARLGIIPAAMPFVGKLVEALIARHGDVRVSVRALTSRQIERDLAAFELDAGLTYLDFEPPAHVLRVPLYTEHYMLAVAAQTSLAMRDEIAWDEAASLPLCLLHQGMQNRRILDAKLSRRGLALQPVVTADSYVALLALVQQRRLCSIIPDSHVPLLSGSDWLRLIPLTPPDEGSQIGLVVSDRAPLGQMAEAILAVSRSIASEVD